MPQLTVLAKSGVVLFSALDAGMRVWTYCHKHERHLSLWHHLLPDLEDQDSDRSLSEWVNSKLPSYAAPSLSIAAVIVSVGCAFITELRKPKRLLRWRLLSSIVLLLMLASTLVSGSLYFVPLLGVSVSVILPSVGSCDGGLSEKNVRKSGANYRNQLCDLSIRIDRALLRAANDAAWTEASDISASAGVNPAPRLREVPTLSNIVSGVLPSRSQLERIEVPGSPLYVDLDACMSHVSDVSVCTLALHEEMGEVAKAMSIDAEDSNLNLATESSKDSEHDMHVNAHHRRRATTIEHKNTCSGVLPCAKSVEFRGSMSRYSRSRSRSRSRHRRRYDRSRSRSRSRSRRRRHRTRSRSAERSPPATAVTSNAPAVATKPPQQLANVTDSTGKPVDPMAILAPGNVNVERTRAARRLFVGNLPISMRLTPAGLQRFFTDALGELGIVTPHPVLSVWINSEGSFCFVELRSVKDTDTSLQLLEGVTLGGRPLRVGRPADYAAAPGSLADFVVPL
ncbi:MAG: hypothetical protein MHM6MM_008075, partial [Cercozoa sp. M6MM]